ncbi:hypothetical protein [Sulfurimonas diazotrophicus]|uniref:Uncharacterized protein n=1 Tax=Sulfurimonas diazotrophicus TaxID=3131939 RepID=A0ABZ3H6A7_9BACT
MQGENIKKFLKIIWLVATAVLVSWGIYFFSLFVAWGGAIEPNTGKLLAITAGMIFFGVGFVKTINKKTDPQMEKEKSLLKKGLGLIIFIFPFAILTWMSLPILLIWNGTYLKLYKYHAFPCENVTFKTKEKMVLISNKDGMLPRSAYFLTHNTLEILDKDLERSPWILSYVPNGEEYKIIGFYLAQAKGFSDNYYYLAQDVGNNESKALINVFSFDSRQCYPRNVTPYDKALFFPKRKSYNEEEIDLSDLKMAPYENPIDITNQRRPIKNPRAAF